MDITCYENSCGRFDIIGRVDGSLLWEGNGYWARMLLMNINFRKQTIANRGLSSGEVDRLSDVLNPRSSCRSAKTIWAWLPSSKWLAAGRMQTWTGKFMGLRVPCPGQSTTIALVVVIIDGYLANRGTFDHMMEHIRPITSTSVQSNGGTKRCLNFRALATPSGNVQYLWFTSVHWNS